KPRLGICVLLLFAVIGRALPDRDNLYSAPALPSADVLDRLNLKLVFSARAPIENRRDGLVSVQLAPIRIDGKSRMRLLVQTRAGVVLEMDGETGQIYWRARVGNAWSATQALGFNATDVVAVRGTDVYGISRKDGEVRWKMSAAGGSTTRPLMDSMQLYLNLGDRVEA